MKLEPMLASEQPVTRVLDYAADDGWALERKVDGHRILLVIDDGHPTTYGRGGQLSQHGSLFADESHRLTYAGLPDHVVLDGELVDGVLWIFDLPEVRHVTNGASWATDPFMHRRALLEEVFWNWAPPASMFRLLGSETTHADKTALAVLCMREHAEGLVAKRIAAPYRPGVASPDIVKLKFVHDVDCHVTALGFESRDNAVLSVYQDGQPVEVGRASTLGKGPIDVGDVVVVRYSRFSTGGRLVQPRIVRRRQDKAPAECRYDQLAVSR